MNLFFQKTLVTGVHALIKSRISNANSQDKQAPSFRRLAPHNLPTEQSLINIYFKPRILSQFHMSENSVVIRSAKAFKKVKVKTYELLSSSEHFRKKRGKIP